MSYLLLRPIMTKNYLLMEGLCLVIHFVWIPSRTFIYVILKKHLYLSFYYVQENVALGYLSVWHAFLFQTPCVPRY